MLYYDFYFIDTFIKDYKRHNLHSWNNVEYDIYIKYYQWNYFEYHFFI